MEAGIGKALELLGGEWCGLAWRLALARQVATGRLSCLNLRDAEKCRHVTWATP
jgi:hypothetical protein